MRVWLPWLGVVARETVDDTLIRRMGSESLLACNRADSVVMDMSDTAAKWTLQWIRLPVINENCDIGMAAVMFGNDCAAGEPVDIVDYTDGEGTITLMLPTNVAIYHKVAVVRLPRISKHKCIIQEGEIVTSFVTNRKLRPYRHNMLIMFLLAGGLIYGSL